MTQWSLCANPARHADPRWLSGSHRNRRCTRPTLIADVASGAVTIVVLHWFGVQIVMSDLGRGLVVVVLIVMVVVLLLMAAGGIAVVDGLMLGAGAHTRMVMDPGSRVLLKMIMIGHLGCRRMLRLVAGGYIHMLTMLWMQQMRRLLELLLQQMFLLCGMVELMLMMKMIGVCYVVVGGIDCRLFGAVTKNLGFIQKFL